jgi:polar amino acid transport system substrate-binding protein
MLRPKIALVSALSVAALVLATGATSGASGLHRKATTYPTLASCKTTVQSQVKTKGTLTVATDNPVYTPWFVGNNPSNGKGYESAVTYAIASKLGFAKKSVKWVTEPFDSSYQAGPKNFDFDINEISYTSERAQAVTFSISYYGVTQSIVALKGSKIAKNHSPAALKTYLYGDQIGTTGLTYIESQLKPTKTPRIYNSLALAVQALQSKQIDAIVVDTPDGQYMASSEVKNGVQVGQFPSTGEHYGLLFQKGNPLASCVDSAIQSLTASGTLASISKEYLGIYNSIPTIQP